MRIASTPVHRQTGSDAPVDETKNTEAASSDRKARAAEAATSASQSTRPVTALRGGLSQWDPRFNQQLSAAQQAVAYLSQLESRLQNLKARLSAQIAAAQSASAAASAAGGQSGDPALQSDLEAFANLWQQRQTAGGGLDGQLAYSAEAAPQQRFTIKGLDRQTLQAGPKETLAFSVGARGQAPVLVTVDPSLSEETQLRAFQKAFAPAGIGVSMDPSGQLGFSVAESHWVSVRDTLAVKGNGIRFPTGQMARVKAEPKAEAIRPRAWSNADVDAARRTLQEVVDALARVRQVEEKVSRALVEARQQLQAAATASDGEWAQTLAVDFSSLASQPTFDVYSAIAPALTSISRDRVVALLALD